MHKCVLLIVEDNPLLLKMYQTAFERAGLAILVAHNADEGLRIAKEKLPECLVLDLHMPGMSGFELLKLMRAMPDFGRMKIVVLTSDARKDVRQQVLAMGADAFISKAETDIHEVVNVVHRVMHPGSELPAP